MSLLGWFQALAESGAVTSDEFAQRAGIQERYVREWRSAMACHRYLAYVDSTKRFTLPDAHRKESLRLYDSAEDSIRSDGDVPRRGDDRHRHRYRCPKIK